MEKESELVPAEAQLLEKKVSSSVTDYNHTEIHKPPRLGLHICIGHTDTESHIRRHTGGEQFKMVPIRKI